MLNSSLNAEADVNQLRLDEFKIKGDVKMVGQLPHYDDLRDFDLPNEGN